MYILQTRHKNNVAMITMILAQAMSSTALDTSDAETTFGSKLFATYIRAASIATTLFPLWTVLFTGMALKSPSSFAWFTTEYFTAALAALMLSMGITLKPEDFAKVAKRPNSVFIQFALCYAMMPLLALFLGKACGLDSALLAGVVLVGSINGGQASNLCTYIAKGNVALSVLMTTATTLGAIFMTPLLCKTLLGAIVPVDAVGIAMSTIQVVLAPIAVGMFLNKNFPKVVKAILPFAPVVGVVSTCLLVASAVAQVAEPIRNAGMSLQIPVLLLHLLGGLVGFILPKLLGFGEVACRTMAIETSMKSSAFGFLLAKLHFGQYAARVPSAVSVVWMALTGSMLAVIWRYIPVPQPKVFDRSLLEKYPPFQPKKMLKNMFVEKED
uniref:Bile acid:sodium symporter n=1 Tax=Corethron hystrix TaxID=216773 RepID=A0A7S1BK48_9STRA|mmetsp:Transcript_28720/g.65627  ORF Transcript_28720/g.65627 Transcript_28720/m.65627 type:complete len:384 (+) Transcript_28720:697-1848(+)